MCVYICFIANYFQTELFHLELPDTSFPALLSVTSFGPHYLFLIAVL